MNQKGFEHGVADESAATDAPSVESEVDGVMLDIAIQEQLGKVFRAYCDDLIHQPIPDKFAVLLARLEAKQREKK